MLANSISDCLSVQHHTTHVHALCSNADYYLIRVQLCAKYRNHVFVCIDSDHCKNEGCCFSIILFPYRLCVRSIYIFNASEISISLFVCSRATFLVSGDLILKRCLADFGVILGAISPEKLYAVCDSRIVYVCVYDSSIWFWVVVGFSLFWFLSWICRRNSDDVCFAHT